MLNFPKYDYCDGQTDIQSDNTNAWVNKETKMMVKQQKDTETK